MTTTPAPAAGPLSAPDSPPPAFDPCGPLPQGGVTLLEASAGTGKTFTIAALTARFVAEGTPINQILAVTFTRMATAELRDRVRARLVSAEAQLGLILDTGAPPPAGDRLVELLATGARPAVELRRQHLADALAVFDAATITTTHGFCHLVLAGLGVAGRVGTGATLIEDPGDIVEAAVDDLYLRGMRRWGPMPFGQSTARSVATAAVHNPTTPLEPAPSGEQAGLQRRLAEGVRREAALRLLDANLLTYDDLLVRLEETLADPVRGPVACEILRDRYRVVLVDEFQDTDPVQWDVVRRAFGGGQTTLVLIGDPKQAIYAFRGADVFSYIEAAEAADRRFTLTENWRSDEGLLQAYDALLHPLNVGHPGITYRTVTATEAHRRPGLAGPPVAAPLRVRMLHTGDRLVRMTAGGKAAQKDAAVEWVAGDVAVDITGLLASGARLVAPLRELPDRSRPVAPGDIAVLVRTNQQASRVQEALRQAQVPAVVGGTDSVFATESAADWLRLLEALEQPASRPRAASVALTPFGGMTALDVAEASETTWEDLHARLHRWADVVRRKGVATLARIILAGEGLPARVLAQSTGERRLTDLAHIAQLLHAEGSSSQLGPSALRAWLADRIDESGVVEAAEAEERSRRLDSDADAVQVLTIHRAKGLEFPVVYCPYLWDPGPDLRTGQPAVYHDPGAGYRRTLDVGGAEGNPGYQGHFDLARDELRGEDLRLLYVALTRARHQAVVWWVRGWHAQHSPLGRLLMFRDLAGNVPALGPYELKDAPVQRRLDELAAKAPGLVSVERCAARSAAVWHGPPVPPEDLAAARFERTLDLTWRRTSYTGITDGAHDEVVGSEPEEPGVVDEPEGGLTPVVASGPGAPGDGGDGPGGPGTQPPVEIEGTWDDTPAPLAAMPRGAEVGTLVHQILERVDFASPDLPAEVAAVVAAEHGRRPVEIGPVDAVIRGLVAAISTPLGPLAGGARLRDVGRADRLDELRFELPLAGGDQPEGEVLTADIARLFAAHTAAGDPLVGYSSRLESPVLASHLRGYLTGSLDLVLRVQGGSGQPRFLVIDYKTNWLAPEGEPLTSRHYRPAALADAMQRAHYPLQAVLYLVALHRYLRWRMRDYDPATHLGGVLYLFVRGMTGPDTPVVGDAPCGVFAWPAPVGLVTGLSDLLDAGSPGS